MSCLLTHYLDQLQSLLYVLKTHEPTWNQLFKLIHIFEAAGGTCVFKLYQLKMFYSDVIDTRVLLTVNLVSGTRKSQSFAGYKDFHNASARNSSELRAIKVQICPSSSLAENTEPLFSRTSRPIIFSLSVEEGADLKV